MKKTILISIGALLILLIVGVWVYLFMYGAPKSADEVFTRFGFGDSVPEPEVIVERTDEPVVDVSGEGDTAPEKLRQLTVRPVAGATFTELGILYVEEGTGHVYHIDLDTGTEKLLSGTTIPGARDASFSADGSYVAISSLAGGEEATVVGFVDTLAGNLAGVSLPRGAREIAWSGTSSLVMYLLPDVSGSSGHSYDLESEAGKRIFSLPLSDIRVLWGNPTYVYTTPSGSARGFLYRLDGSRLAYVAAGGRGLTGLPYDSGVVITKVTDAGVSSLSQSDAGTTTDLSLPLIPEKCTRIPVTSASFYCGVPNELSSGSFPDSWYMGLTSYSDTILSVNAETNEWTFWSDPLAESGRAVDVGKIGTDALGELIYFINKNDNTLWMFDTTL